MPSPVAQAEAVIWLARNRAALNRSLGMPPDWQPPGQDEDKP